MIATVDTDPAQRAELLFQALSQGTSNYLSILNKGADITARADDRAVRQEEETNRHGLALRQFRQSQVEDARDFARGVFEDNRDFGFRAHQANLSNARADAASRLARERFDYGVEQDSLRLERQEELDRLELEQNRIEEEREAERFRRERAEFEREQEELRKADTKEDHEKQKRALDAGSLSRVQKAIDAGNVGEANRIISNIEDPNIRQRALNYAKRAGVTFAQPNAALSETTIRQYQSNIDRLISQLADTEDPEARELLRNRITELRGLLNGGQSTPTSPQDAGFERIENVPVPGSSNVEGGFEFDIEPPSGTLDGRVTEDELGVDTAPSSGDTGLFRPKAARPRSERSSIATDIVGKKSDLNLTDDEAEAYSKAIQTLKEDSTRITTRPDRRNSQQFNQEDFEAKMVREAEKIVDRINKKVIAAQGPSGRGGRGVSRIGPGLNPEQRRKLLDTILKSIAEDVGLQVRNRASTSSKTTPQQVDEAANILSRFGL